MATTGLRHLLCRPLPAFASAHAPTPGRCRLSAAPTPCENLIGPFQHLVPAARGGSPDGARCRAFASRSLVPGRGDYLDLQEQRLRL